VADFRTIQTLGLKWDTAIMLLSSIYSSPSNVIWKGTFNESYRLLLSNPLI